MSFPLVGVGLPMVGPHAGPDAIETVAVAADRLGYQSMSVFDRLLLPAAPDWSNDFGLPEYPAYDAVETLTWVAAKTARIRLRTDVLVPLFQQPVVLARRLATLDHLSRGRVDAGLALGWLPEEFAATGVASAGRAAAFEESVAAIRACWGPDPVEYHGAHYRIPRAKIGPKPIDGRIRIFVGGVSQPAIERAARIGDGVTIGFRNWNDTLAQIAWYRDAGGAGPIVVKGGPMLADAEHKTPPTTWTEPSVLDDLARAKAAGIDEFIWDLNIVGYEPRRQVEVLESLAAQLRQEGAQLRQDADLRPAAAQLRPDAAQLRR
jgi:probable F420-dependent oxidoreductase